MKANMNNSSPELEAFKRAPSLGLSQWENGNLTTNLAEKKDTNGAFLLVEAMLAPGTEPPPHVHTREGELFYVLEGEFDVYVGEKAFNVKTGECVFMPRFRPHAFIIRSASPSCFVYTRGTGGTFSPHEHTCSTPGSSHRDGHLFDRGFEPDCATTQRVRCTLPNSG
jgi:mannose-6-phosphate isomerase-like protein (cupin superfamily)